jgi:NADH:ubiquinone oxidoreductase subunit E
MSLTLRRFFQPKATIQYPEMRPDVAVRFRGRLQLLYDEWGSLKCETCFQCAQACPVECIDMGGFDTMGRFHVHWGEGETYGERREESAMRRSGRPVPDPEFDYDPKQTLRILEAIQAEYGHLPVAALKRYSQISGAPYALLYGRASYYHHLRLQESGTIIRICGCPSCALAGAGQIARILAAELRTEVGRKPDAGGISLEYLTGHTPVEPSPLVTLNGEPQEITPQNAAAWVAGVAHAAGVEVASASGGSGAGAARAAGSARASRVSRAAGTSSGRPQA